jgi:hypothetical protein
MPALTNDTLKKEFRAVAKVLAAQNSNLTNEAVAAVIVRTIFSETSPEYMEADYKEHRAAMIALIKPLITAPNNIQNTWLAETKDEAGVPIMPKVQSVKQAALSEFI